MKNDPNWEKKLEDEWGRALVHESGHALMAVLQGIVCHGIYFLKDGKKACALINPLPQPSEYSRKHYLFLAAGSAAEQITLGDQDYVASKSDRLLYGNHTAPSFEESVREACAILLGNARHLMRLVSTMKENIRQADYNFSHLPERDVYIDGVLKKPAVLLSDKE